MSGLSTYTHVQEVASSAWVINHNLGKLVNVDTILTINGTRHKVLPLKVVADPSLNQITVFWSAPRVGTAVIS